ncbi:hypothetical protein PGT21_032146 [Puccinia graminis f. sp. tritici]|uniref:Uncharacterized protein n=1 Tax=Puccinia graminis f. sp. tritici TaxID=56615 RepID=A0A5B0NDT3_PUCGR|nr:hypothetical protein PGT21_032146 [Puccinia graminis f. sp. tritici]
MDLSDSYKEIYVKCGELLQGMALLYPKREEVLKKNIKDLFYFTDITKKNDDKLFETAAKSQENIESYTESGSKYPVSIEDKNPQEQMKALFQSWKNQYNDSSSKILSRKHKPGHCKSIRASSQIKLQLLQSLLAKLYDENDLSFGNLDAKLKQMKTLLHQISIYHKSY